MATSLEQEVTALARRIDGPSAARRDAVIQTSWWSERMVEWAMSHPSFRTQLFRFIDVFPAMHGATEVMQHLSDYLAATDLPRVVDLALDAAGHAPFGPAAVSAVARRNVVRVATQFIAGADPAQALPILRALWQEGSGFTVDILGESTLTEAEADRYAARVEELLLQLAAGCPAWPADPRLERDDRGPLPRINVSIKPSALGARYGPLTREDGLAQARSRLLPLLRRAVELGAFVNVDMEQYDVCELSLELFRTLLGEPELASLHAGITVQAYLREAEHDLRELISEFGHRLPPITIRLVKGAYWDSEVVQARAQGWPAPVFERKAETDASFERCARLLHDHHGEVRAAFGSHNPRSLAHAIAYARSRGIPDDGYEIQALHGMAGSLVRTLRELGLRTRVYAPVGQLLPGMSYLVRRLLENTSNESIIRQRFDRGADSAARHRFDPGADGAARRADEGARAAPAPSRHAGDVSPPPAVGHRRATRAPLPSPAPYHHEPTAEWRRAAPRRAFAAAIAGVQLGRSLPAVIDGQEVRARESFESTDPGDPATVVATATACGRPEVEQAVEGAARSLSRWSATPVAERAAVLFRAAAWLRERRDRIAALEVVEAGKPWREADADVCEAIDFCEYYGREALALEARGAVVSPPGERNALHRQPRGVCAVISPWNFPLAIPTGMVAAALVTGNTVVLKPAEQTPAVAAVLVDALRAAGLPRGALSFVPGTGEEAGAPVVEHPEVSVIAFTGSREVGLGIVETASRHQPGQRHVTRVIAEMGGKNAIVVDSDADLDRAVPIIVESAFGYSGQKCSACSRLIVLDRIHDELVSRLVGATRELRVGHPREMGVDLGPLIDATALDRVRSYIEHARREGEVVLANGPVPASGHYVAPAIIDGVDPSSPLAENEIFGPLLVVLRAGDLDEALAVANHTEYALTAGIVSRSPSHIERAAAELRAGNVYVNRAITGAVVGRQPFGGYGLSGVGSKAGGPDYLLQFVDTRTISENTVRQGFAPTEWESYS